MYSPTGRYFVSEIPRTNLQKNILVKIVSGKRLPPQKRWRKRSLWIRMCGKYSFYAATCEEMICQTRYDNTGSRLKKLRFIKHRLALLRWKRNMMRCYFLVQALR